MARIEIEFVRPLRVKSFSFVKTIYAVLREYLGDSVDRKEFKRIARNVADRLEEILENKVNDDWFTATIYINKSKEDLLKEDFNLKEEDVELKDLYIYIPKKVE